MRRGPLRAIFFDLYDTLIYRDDEIHLSGRRELAALLGVEHALLNERWRRSGWERMRSDTVGLEGHLRQLLLDVGVEPTQELLGQVVEMERANQRAAVHLYPGALEVLAAMRRRGFSVGLISNASSSAATALEHLGLLEAFDSVTLSYRVGSLKPEPGIYLAACDSLGVAPHEAAFVADGAFNELNGAHDLGMLAIRVTQDHQSPDFGASDYHDYEIQGIGQLPALLDRLRAGRGDIVDPGHQAR